MPERIQRRALFIHHSSNPAILLELDALEALLAADPAADWTIERRRLRDLGKDLLAQPDRSLPLLVEQYAIIAIQFAFNGLHASVAGGAEALQEIQRRARDGAVMLPVCDIALSVDGRIRSSLTNEWVEPFKERPVRVIGSFTPGILDSGLGQQIIHKRWMRLVHPDSEFITLEWLFGHLTITEHRMAVARQSDLVQEARRALPVRLFYYGLNKPGVVPSLKKMGLGMFTMDAVLGTISERFPKVRNIALKSRGKDGITAPVWATAAAAAQRNLYPYEPVKGDFQVTLRFAELAALDVPPDRIMIDARVSRDVRPFVSIDAWRDRFDEVASGLASLGADS